jgi:hypothetical protein
VICLVVLVCHRLVFRLPRHRPWALPLGPTTPAPPIASLLRCGGAVVFCRRTVRTWHRHRRGGGGGTELVSGASTDLLHAAPSTSPPPSSNVFVCTVEESVVSSMYCALHSGAAEFPSRCSLLSSQPRRSVFAVKVKFPLDVACPCARPNVRYRVTDRIVTQTQYPSSSSKQTTPTTTHQTRRQRWM